jgi:hypothetical protein
MTSALLYYKTSDDGRPLRQEIFSVKPWCIYEIILTNAQMTIDEGLLTSEDSPFEAVSFDVFVQTNRRKCCRKTKACVYETSLDSRMGNEIPFLSFSWDGQNAIGLSIGRKERLDRINRLSGYPYLDIALSRLADELGITAEAFQWRLEGDP